MRNRLNVACDECKLPFHVRRDEETKHVHRDPDGRLWVLCPFCLALARFGDDVRKLGHSSMTWEQAFRERMPPDPRLSWDRPNAWGEE